MVPKEVKHTQRESKKTGVKRYTICLLSFATTALLWLFLLLCSSFQLFQIEGRVFGLCMLVNHVCRFYFYDRVSKIKEAT